MTEATPASDSAGSEPSPCSEPQEAVGVDGGDPAPAEEAADRDAPASVAASAGEAGTTGGQASADQTETEFAGAPPDQGAAAPSEDEGAEASPDAAAAPVQDDDVLRAELEQVQDQRIRLAADFDNYRKRSEERLRARWTHAQADLLTRLLDPLDDLRRVAECDPDTATAESLVEGVVLVERKFARLLEEAGVEVVDPRDQPFDPATMEAIMRVPAEAEDMDDMVERVVQRGFTLKGRLLRPARVAVYKAG